MHQVFFFAVPQERDPFLQRLSARGADFERRTINGLPRLARVHTAPELTVVVTGMGMNNARQTAEIILRQAKPAIVWTCGYAGGLDPRLGVGDLVFAADPQFPYADSLLKNGWKRARFVTVETVAVTQAEKAQLRKESAADAVEMESGAIREIAAMLGCPSATVRAISDTANQDLPLDFNALASGDGGIAPLKLVGTLLSAPYKIPRLIRFGRDTARVGRLLADALDAASRCAPPLPVGRGQA